MSDRFVNPYNFIPLVGKKAEAYKHEDGEKTFTGAITYKITTKTPLIIPATDNSNAFSKNSKGDSLIGVAEHKSYDFYSYTDSKEGEKKDNQYNEPVIPGSEIRGMIRSIYETLTDSCMSILNDDQTIAKRTGAVFAPGLIKAEGGKLFLYNAESVRCVKNCVSKDDPEGMKVFFDLELAKANDKPEAPLVKSLAKEGETGYLIKGAKGPGKKHYHVLYLTSESEHVCEFGAYEKKILDKVIESYSDQNESNNYKKYEKSLKKFYDEKQEGACFPVYYSKVSDGKREIFYFSPAAITKELAGNTVAGRTKSWTPCKTEKDACPACDLFGMVGENGEAKASSIRVADAYLKTKDVEFKALYEGVTTLQALNSPKISNSEFYLKKPTPTATFWTYDYYIDGGKIHFYKEGDVIIRGRKFYWHQPEMRIQNFPPDKMNVTVRPLKRNIAFGGKIYFEQITKKQLEQIIFIINGGKEGEYDYKIGMGKPLGYGSVHTKVECVELRNISVGENGVEYSIIQYDGLKSYEENGFSNSVKEAFEIMMSFDTLKGQEVSYPLVENQKAGTEGFKWFTEQNHLKRAKDGSHKKGMRNDRKEEVLEKVLPVLDEDKDYSLPKKIVEQPNNNKTKPNKSTSSTNNHKQGQQQNEHKCEYPGCKKYTKYSKQGKPFKYCFEHKDFG